MSSGKEDEDERRNSPPQEELVRPEFASPARPDVGRVGPHFEERAPQVHDLECKPETDPGQRRERGGTRAEDQIRSITAAVV